jgi:hypothetical protein
MGVLRLYPPDLARVGESAKCFASPNTVAMGWQRAGRRPRPPLLWGHFGRAPDRKANRDRLLKVLRVINHNGEEGV